ncbi:MAG: phenylacetate-CoA oxygenase subunit PaaI [Candidatus Tectomicrobia bacterium]|nr:phenylacetate-CoA oxygenase subunit PaaI [Candidatus Tectomicrobia bacterium]
MRTYRSKEEMPHDYYAMLVDIMTRQFLRELENSAIFGRAIQYAPSWRAKAELAEISYEEAQHGIMTAPILEGLGIDLKEIDNRWRLAEAFLGNVDEVQDWVEMIVYCSLIDRAGKTHVAVLAGNSYEPYAAIMDKIVEDEEGHESYGEEAIAEICQDPAQRQRVGQLFRKWLPRCVKLLGKPRSAANRFCVEHGLKNRDSEEEIREYLDYCRQIAKNVGIPFPTAEELRAEGVILPRGWV